MTAVLIVPRRRRCARVQAAWAVSALRKTQKHIIEQTPFSQQNRPRRSIYPHNSWRVRLSYSHELAVLNSNGGSMESPRVQTANVNECPR